MRKYDNGGPVTPEDDSDEPDQTNESGTPIVGPMADGSAPSDATPQDTSYLDKLAAVVKAMGLGGKAALNTVTGGAASLADNAASGATPAIASGIAQAVPYAVQAANQMGGLNLPVPAAPAQTPSPAPVAAAPANPAPSVATAPITPPVTPKAPVVAPTAPGASATPGTGPVANMLTTMIGGDPDKLQAVLAQLKDQQTRGQFAKALATIGDTFANVGMARAGKDPQGYKGTAIVDQNNKDTQANLVDNMKTQLANDPNSQTSKFAQMSAANILGIKPGDPRAAQLAKAPAAVLSAQLPPLADSVKVQLDREAQGIQQKQFEESKAMQAQQILQQQKDREAQLQLGQMSANTAREHEKAETAGSAVEHLSPLNPFNWGTIAAAKNTIQGAVGGGQPTAANPHLPVIHSHAQYNALPRGAQYQDANGKAGVKI